MTTELDNTAEEVLAGPLSYSTDGQVDDPDDMTPLPFRLMQGLSPAVMAGDARPGEYQVLGVGPIDNPVIVPVARNKSRNRRVEDPDDPDEQVLICHSPDGRTGHGTPGGDCATCPYSKWEGRTPPLCTDQWSFIIYMPNDGILAEWSLQRTSMPIAKTINSLISMSGFGKLAFELKSAERGRGSRKYFVPVLKKVDVPEDFDYDTVMTAVQTKRIRPAQEQESADEVTL